MSTPKNARTNNSQIACRLSEMELITSKVTGGGAGTDGVVAASSIDVLTCAYGGATGVFNLTFGYRYPQKIMPLMPTIVGTTTGLVAIFTAWDPFAGTAQVKFSVGGVATDPATTDTIYFGFLVRNSGRNPSTY